MVCQTELVWQIVRITRIQDVTLSGIIIGDTHYFSFADEGLIEYEIHVGT